MRNDINAATDDSSDQTGIPERLDRLLNGPARYLVLLGKTVDRRQGTARRKLAALDPTSQNLSKLQVDRYVTFVINRHMGDCR